MTVQFTMKHIGRVTNALNVYVYLTVSVIGTVEIFECTRMP